MMNAATTTSKTATYNGRTYRVLFLGQTKFGRRAHLAFMDGSKDFWVAADRIQSAPAFAGICEECGQRAARGTVCWETGARH